MTITNTRKREKKVMDKEEKRENTDENWSTMTEFVGLSSYELQHYLFASVC